MRSKRPKINWRDFYAESPYHVDRVMHVELASLQHRKVVEIEPLSNSCFFHVVLVVAPSSKRSVIKGRTIPERPVDILVDTSNNKWVYVHRFSVVNWPPRYKFTVKDKEVIYEAIAKYVNEVYESPLPAF